MEAVSTWSFMFLHTVKFQDFLSLGPEISYIQIIIDFPSHWMEAVSTWSFMFLHTVEFHEYFPQITIVFAFYILSFACIIVVVFVLFISI
jgi:hypothetical protein